MKETLRIKGAKVLVETCAGVKPGEKVLVVTDSMWCWNCRPVRLTEKS